MAELYSLPDGWEWKKLENISKKIFAGGDKPDKVSEFKTDELNIPIYANAVKNNGLYGYSNIYKVDEECITISARGTIGFTVVRNEKFFPIVRLIVLIPNEQVLSKILKYYLDYELVENTGSSIPQLTVPTVKELFFPLPPLEEQKRIVAKLDNLFAKIDKAIALHQKNIDEADIFMASVLNDVFAELEEKYKKRTIGSFSKVGTGATPLKNRNDFYENGNINWITSKATNDDYVYESEQLITEIALNECRLKINPIGTIIVALYGQGKTRGQVSELMIESSTNQALATIIVDENESINTYLKYFLKKSYFDIREKASGGTQPNLNLSIIKNIELSLPPLQIQQKVVAYLDEISNKMEKIKQIQKDKMQSLKELKASILDKAFKGEL